MDLVVNDSCIKRVFLIDTENISSFEFIDRYEVDECDEIVFFISKNSKNINPKDFIKLTENKAKKVFEYVDVGLKNALDYQLVVYLTIRALSEGEDIYIVSNDKGYLIALDYLRKNSKCNLYLVKEKDLDCGESSKQPQLKPREDDLETIELKIEKILKEKGKVQEAVKVINAAPKVRRLSHIHNGFINSFGNAEGKRLYDNVKSSLKKYYSSEV